MFVSGLSIETSPLGMPERERIQARAIGAYLGLAVGDALGATVEFMTPREIRDQYREHREMSGGGWLRLRRGQITDDTQMSLALGGSILRQGGVEALAVAEAFSDWMRGKPVDIGHTVRRGIAQYRRTGVPVMEESEFAAGNGACMRCLPIALLTLGAAVETVNALNQRQAHVTHNNPVSDAGSLCVIRMVQAAILGGDKRDLRGLADALVAAQPAFAYDRKRCENPGGFIVETLRAVLQSLFATDGFEAALVEVVNRGGDADTTGAILGMIAGALYGPDSLPTRWTRQLAPEIRQQCIDQAGDLIKLSPVYRDPGLALRILNGASDDSIDQSQPTSRANRS